MNPAPVALGLACVAGSLMAVQTPTNALLGRALGSPISAAFVSFVIGTLALGLILLVVSVRPDPATVRSLPWYAWIGGLYGAFFVAVATYGAPKIGVAALLTAAVTGQLIAAAILDHFGAFGMVKQSLSMMRVSGLTLVSLGVVLVFRG